MVSIRFCVNVKKKRNQKNHNNFQSLPLMISGFFKKTQQHILIRTCVHCSVCVWVVVYIFFFVCVSSFRLKEELAFINTKRKRLEKIKGNPDNQRQNIGVVSNKIKQLNQLTQSKEQIREKRMHLQLQLYLQWYSETI